MSSPKERADAQRPDIFRYADARTYLGHWWTWKKTVSPRTSFRSFGDRAGCSPSLLKDVMEGRRRLTTEAAGRFAKAMGLGEREGRYLLAMAAFSGSRTAQSRSEAFEELTRLRHQAFVKYLAPQQYAAWSQWHHMAIRELVGLEGFSEDPEAIAQRLEPPIKAREAARSLEILQDLGLLVRDRTGRLVAADPAISSEYEVPSPVLRHFNQQMIQLALTAPDRIDPAHREVSGLTLGLSRECYDRIKERLRMFKQEILSMVEEDPRPSTLVAQFNVQLFPLVQPREEAP